MADAIQLHIAATNRQWSKLSINSLISRLTRAASSYSSDVITISGMTPLNRELTNMRALQSENAIQWKWHWSTVTHWVKPVDEVAEVVEQLAVVLQHEVVPTERAVLWFWPHKEEVEPPDVGGDVRVLCVVPKHPHSTTLGKLAVFVV